MRNAKSLAESLMAIVPPNRRREVQRELAAMNVEVPSVSTQRADQLDALYGLDVVPTMIQVLNDKDDTGACYFVHALAWLLGDGMRRSGGAQKALEIITAVYGAYEVQRPDALERARGRRQAREV